MPGFSSFDDMISEMTTNGKRNQSGFSKVGVIGTAGVWQSLWRLGGLPAAGADGAAGSGTPGSGGTALTSASGSINFANCSTDLRFLINAFVGASQNTTLMLYDRLTHTSGVSVASTGSKNVGSAGLPRYNNTSTTTVDFIGGNECWLEVTTATTVTIPVVHLLTYTNQAGSSGQVGGSFTFPLAATVVQSLVGPLPLASGDSGVRSVETLNVDTAGSAGVVQVVIMRPIAYIPVIQNIANVMNFVLQMPSLPQLFDGHSIGMAILMPATTATTVFGEIVAAYG